MSEVIEVLLRRGDNSVTVLTYVVRDVSRTYDASSEAIASYIQRYFPDTLEFRRVSPQDEFNSAKSYADPYFNAWQYGKDTITHDMSKARDIYRAHVREARAPALGSLDIEYQRADEAEDRSAKRAIAVQKQRLRDAPADPRIDACQTIEELRALNVLEDTP